MSDLDHLRRMRRRVLLVEIAWMLPAHLLNLGGAVGLIVLANERDDWPVLMLSVHMLALAVFLAGAWLSSLGQLRKNRRWS
ncbi:hypothetical protein NR798_24195 [Archangium gephyra]|uniref:hypothetical protein n=1 Tax=Archangium gephyra TaxID=48 RepID=UPI0035D44271